MPEKKIVNLQRVAVIVIALLAFLMSLTPDVVFAVALLATAGLGSCFGPLVMFSLYTDKVNQKGAVTSIIVGLVSVIVWYYSGLSSYIYVAIPGIIFSTIALLLVSKLTGGADAETRQQFREYVAKLKARSVR